MYQFALVCFSLVLSLSVAHMHTCHLICSSTCSLCFSSLSLSHTHVHMYMQHTHAHTHAHVGFVSVCLFVSQSVHDCLYVALSVSVCYTRLHASLSVHLPVGHYCLSFRLLSLSIFFLSLLYCMSAHTNTTSTSK